jgi:NAD(P)H-flavin reductase/hemoglobin-like flavoprotein
MRASFAKAAATGDEAPLYFYSHLFLTHPEVRDMFPVSMATQRDRFFTALGDVVARVDDLDALVPTLRQLGRDHRKFGTLAAHYPAAGASLLATLEHFDDEWTDELAKQWTEAYNLVADVMIEAAEVDAGPPWWEADVVEHERRTFDVAVLQLRPREPLDFRAGQSISVETELRPRLWRFYSPANAPRPDGTIELHVQAREGGPVSTALVQRIGVGDVLRLGPPLGSVALDGESDRDLLLVAGGTGLAPMKALIDEVARHGPERRVDLFAGARTEDRLYERTELERLDKEHGWLSVTLAVSEDDQSSLEHGEIGDVVQRHGPWRSRDVYVAGPQAMVDDTRCRLQQSGVRAERIRTEAFAPSRQAPDVNGKVTE